MEEDVLSGVCGDEPWLSGPWIFQESVLPACAGMTGGDDGQARHRCSRATSRCLAAP